MNFEFCGAELGKRNKFLPKIIPPASIFASRDDAEAVPLPGDFISQRVSWAVNHGIEDLGVSANGFGGGSWSYTLHPGEFSGNVVINEFLAANVSTNGLRDEDGDWEDWIELYNRGGTAVNLGGWSLTDDAAQVEQWVLPAVTLGPGQYLVVFASGKDRRPTDGGKLHANFKLSAAGQYLGLFNANFPRAVATQRRDHGLAQIHGGAQLRVGEVERLAERQREPRTPARA